MGVGGSGVSVGVGGIGVEVGGTGVGVGVDVLEGASVTRGESPLVGVGKAVAVESIPAIMVGGDAGVCRSRVSPG